MGLGGCDGGGEGLEAMLLCEFLESGNNEWNGIEAVVMPMQLIGLVWWKKEGRMHSIRSDPIGLDRIWGFRSLLQYVFVPMVRNNL
jgi:hypothetical protein